VSSIVIRGARQHNLKGISLEIPRDRLVVITGPSGSGKSSLAMDTIYAEGQRRYVESLSSYARQFLARLPKPDVDLIDGLSPAIAIDQRSSVRTPRSTVGTVSEIHDYLRLLYTHVGEPECPQCGRPVNARTVPQMIEQILASPEGRRLALLAPVVRDRRTGLARELRQLRREGFARIRLDGEVRDLDEEIDVDGRRKHTLEVFVDRLTCKPEVRSRLADSLETALRLSGGLVVVSFEDGEEQCLSERYACPDCGVSLPPLEPRLFSFNNPAGACPACSGLGHELVFSPDLVLGDRSRSLSAGAVLPWARRGSTQLQRLSEVAAALDLDLDVPWRDLTPDVQELILRGSAEQLAALIEQRTGEPPPHEIEGVIPWLERRLCELQRRKRDEGASEDELFGTVEHELDRYLESRVCASCGGARLRREALAVKVAGRSIAELSSLPIDAALRVVCELDLPDARRARAGRVVQEVETRLGFLVDVGLDYLTLDRAAATLSGGEAQRLRLATQIGAPLAGVLYILDEPSIGMHQRDVSRLLGTLTRLRDGGSTVLVVEHDPDTIRAADWVIDMGPGAGARGGEVVAQGRPDDVAREPASLTGGYLSGRLSIPVPRSRRDPGAAWLVLRGASQHNLADLTARIPLGVLTCVTGVSGSGKSTLVVDTLLPALRRHYHRSGDRPGAYRAIDGLELLEDVVAVDQAPIGRSARSNPATYAGLLGPLRELFAALPDARARGYGKARFSFNIRGGRCEACQGEGTVKVEMHFLPDTYVVCDECGGQRYNRETLEVRFKGLSIAQVLSLTVDEAADLLETIPPLRAKLDLLRSVGLGYLTLGQSATTLSGGEAQRVKLARELSRRASGRTLYVLDEPTTGLHQEDVRRLLSVLQRLVDTGSSVLVIEHHLDVVKSADWVIDLGPEAGSNGGRIVAEGPPEAIAVAPGSHTGRYLKRALRG